MSRDTQPLITFLSGTIVRPLDAVHSCIHPRYLRSSMRRARIHLNTLRSTRAILRFHSVSTTFRNVYTEIETSYGIDLELLVEHIKFIRRLAQTEPLKSGVTSEVDPGPNAVSDEDIAGVYKGDLTCKMLTFEIQDYLRKTGGTCFHAIGSLSMLPRDKNGVVDPHLKASISVFCPPRPV